MASSTPTQADVTSQGKGEILAQWLRNIGITPPSYGEGELMSALANAAGGQNNALGAVGLGPANAAAVSLPRYLVTSQAIVVASGTLQLQAVYLTKGQVITNISFLSGSTAGVTMTHQWGVLATSSLKVVAVSADGTNGLIGANAAITYAFSAAYTVPTSGIYYAGVMVAASGTQPTFAGSVAGNSASNNIAPKTAGTSNTGATTAPALGATLTAITATANTVYVWLT